MKVTEMFYSVSGEGKNAGIPTVFVRLAGCNLRCDYCDTQYAWEGGEELRATQIVERIQDLRSFGWVLITGGEPLFQSEGVHDLMFALKHRGYLVEVETNGSFDPPTWFKHVDCWSVDVKCPSSGELSYGTFRPAWLKRMRKRDQLKFVCGTQEDLDFVRGLLNGVRIKLTILISPLIPNAPDSLTGDVLMSQRGWLQHCAEFCKEQDVRMSLQQHKLVWGNRKGV